MKTFPIGNPNIWEIIMRLPLCVLEASSYKPAG